MGARVRSGLSEQAQSPAAERAILLTVALATMLAPLNSTMIAVALPRVMSAFDADLAAAGWLVTGYLIIMASVQPIAGKLGDRWGRRGLVLGGLAYFAAASIGAALASQLWVLIFFRVQQAVAGAVALPNGTALLREVVPLQRRAARFGLVGALISLAAAGGPVLGGALVSWGGWHAIFYVNVAFILPALWLGMRHLPQRSSARKAGGPFDWLGALLLAAVMMGAAWTLSQSGRLSWAWLVGLAGAQGALLLAWLWCEWRHPDPIVQPRFFAHPTFVAANGGVCFSNFAMYTTFLTIPLLLTQRLGWGEAQVGLALLAMFGANIALSPLGGRLADRLGRRWPTAVGMACLSLGLLPLAWLGWTIDVGWLLGSLFVTGVGVGLSSAGLQTSALEAVSVQDAGVASGVFSTSRYLGSIVGSSLLAGLLGAQRGQLDNLNVVFVLALLAALGALALTLKLQRHPRLEDQAVR